jgi:hypothetical protein
LDVKAPRAQKYTKTTTSHTPPQATFYMLRARAGRLHWHPQRRHRYAHTLTSRHRECVSYALADSSLGATHASVCAGGLVFCPHAEFRALSARQFPARCPRPSPGAISENSRGPATIPTVRICRAPAVRPAGGAKCTAPGHCLEYSRDRNNGRLGPCGWFIFPENHWFHLDKASISPTPPSWPPLAKKYPNSPSSTVEVLHLRHVPHSPPFPFPAGSPVCRATQSVRFCGSPNQRSTDYSLVREGLERPMASCRSFGQGICQPIAPCGNWQTSTDSGHTILFPTRPCKQKNGSVSPSSCDFCQL